MLLLFPTEYKLVNDVKVGRPILNDTGSLYAQEIQIVFVLKAYH